MENVGTSSAVVGVTAPMPKWQLIFELPQRSTYFELPSESTFVNDDLIFAMNRKQGLIVLFDAYTRDQVREFSVYDGPGLSLALLAPNGRELFVTHASYSQEAAIWDITKGVKLFSLPSTLNGTFITAKKALIKCSACFQECSSLLSFSPDSTKIVTLCARCTHLTIFDKTSLTKIVSYQTNIPDDPSLPLSLLPFPGGEKILIPGLSKIRVFDLTTGSQQLIDFGFDARDAKVAFDPSGTQLAVVNDDYIGYIDLLSLAAKVRDRVDNVWRKTIAILFVQNHLQIVEIAYDYYLYRLNFDQIHLPTFLQEETSSLTENRVECLESSLKILDTAFSNDQSKCLMQTFSYLNNTILWINRHALLQKEMEETLSAFRSLEESSTIAPMVFSIVYDCNKLIARRYGWLDLL